MTCEACRERLTAYLDGELSDDRGSAVRGHLRACAACRKVARDEAALRDGLRALPPVDAPASLWANVQARLAAEEMADAERPAWRRALARWARMMQPTLRLGVVAAVAAVVVVAAFRLRGERANDRPGEVATPTPTHAPTVAPAPPAPPAIEGDVTAELDAERARIADSYTAATTELLALATEARPRWSDDQKRAFDTKVGELRRAVDAAPDGRPRQRAQRALVRFLQRAVTRDDAMLAGVAP